MIDPPVKDTKIGAGRGTQYVHTCILVISADACEKAARTLYKIAVLPAGVENTRAPFPASCALSLH